MKKSEKSANGTSFHNSTVLSNKARISEVCGDPDYVDNSGQEKVNFEWIMETEDGDVFTIYSWKEYRELGVYETIEFHIGGMSKAITEKAKDEIECAFIKVK
jgi:hypothetical protein